MQKEFDALCPTFSKYLMLALEELTLVYHRAAEEKDLSKLKTAVTGSAIYLSKFYAGVYHLTSGCSYEPEAALRVLYEKLLNDEIEALREYLQEKEK